MCEIYHSVLNKKKPQTRNVIKLRTGIFSRNTKNVLLFFCRNLIFLTEALILILNVVLYVSKLVMIPTKVLLQI